MEIYGNKFYKRFVRYKRLKEYVRMAPETKPQPGKAVAVLKGGARERTQFTAAAFGCRRKRSLADFAPTLVPVTGVEPVHPCGYGILSPRCLPIPPHRQALIMLSPGALRCQATLAIAIGKSYGIISYYRNCGRIKDVRPQLR